MILEFINEELKKKFQVVHENVKFILRSPMTKDCCVWIKRRKGNAAHLPTFNGVPQPSCNKTLTKYVLGCLVFTFT